MKMPFKPLVHRFDCIAAYEPVTDIRLVGNNDDQEFSALERAHGISNSRKQPKIFKPARSIGFTVADFAAVDHTVAVKKNRPVFSFLGRGRAIHKLGIHQPNDLA